MTHTVQLNLRRPAALARAQIRSRGNLNVLILGLAVIITCGIIVAINPFSLIGYAYYLVIGGVFIYFFDQAEVPRFTRAYLVNALLTAIYASLQVHFYPEAYGCTSPAGLQTDDSYFFSLVADDIPMDLETRPNYFLYVHVFSSVVRYLTPFRVSHPLDILFFLSILAGLICVYTRQFAIQITSSAKVGRTAFTLCQFCPFMLMNGNAVFVRDTFVAALLMLSLACINRRRFIAAIACIVLQFLIRPGTALIILPLYGLIYGGELFKVMRFKPSDVRLLFLGAIFLGAVIAGITARDQLENLLAENNVYIDEFRRLEENVLSIEVGRGAFIWLQTQPLYLRLPIATAYMLLVPFLSTDGLVRSFSFDTRLFLMNIVYPFWIIAVHAWFFAAFFVQKRVRIALRWVGFAVFAGCLLIGAISLQSRHKVLLQPLVYVLAASGCHLAPPIARQAGYVVSGVWFAFQVIYYLSGFRAI